MINGLDWSSWESVTDIRAMMNDQLLIDFAIVRAFDGFRDDQKFVENRKLLKTAKTANGSVLWGAYGFLGYSGAAGSRTWSASRGDYQMQNMWNLISAGGVEFQLPPAIDIEQITFIENGVRQYLPLPAVGTYCAQYLIPAIEYLTEKIKRRPIIYCNPNLIVSYLAPALSKAENKIILECPLWIAGWNRTMTQPPYWDKVKPYWDKWLVWQYAGDVKDWPGIPAVDLNRMPGTRAQLKAWLADPSKPQPSEGATDPIPDPKPEPEPEPSVDLTEILARLAAVESIQNANTAAITLHQERMDKHIAP